MKVSIHPENLDYAPCDYNIFPVFLARLAESEETFKAALADLSNEVRSVLFLMS